MTNNSHRLCPCHSQNTYDECCKPYIENERPAPTPLNLMRSRYCAYATNHIDYIEQTMCKKALVGFDKAQALAWSTACKWLSLEIVEAYDNIVHFIATFSHQGKLESINEKSLFEKKNNRWYYIGEAPDKKTSRNAPCPCGSGKKYKRCCLVQA